LLPWASFFKNNNGGTWIQFCMFALFFIGSFQFELFMILQFFIQKTIEQIFKLAWKEKEKTTKGNHQNHILSGSDNITVSSDALKASSELIRLFLIGIVL
jgi:hypothetical protein